MPMLKAVAYFRLRRPNLFLFVSDRAIRLGGAIVFEKLRLGRSVSSALRVGRR